MINVYFATPGDVHDLDLVNRCAKDELPSWLFEDVNVLKKMILSREYSIVMARDEERCVGYVQGIFERDKRVRVQRIYIKIAYRKQGIARKLMTAFVTYWQSQGEKIVILAEDSTVGFFEHVGFRKTLNYLEEREKDK